MTGNQVPQMIKDSMWGIKKPSVLQACVSFWDISLNLSSPPNRVSDFITKGVGLVWKWNGQNQVRGPSTKQNPSECYFSVLMCI